MKITSILKVGLTISVLTLTACGKAGPEDQAAQLLRQTMKDPTSFSTQDTKIMWQGKDKSNRDAYVVQVNYRAKNSYGTYLPGCNMVAYLDDGNLIYPAPGGHIDSCGVDNAVIGSPEQIAEFMASQFTK